MLAAGPCASHIRPATYIVKYIAWISWKYYTYNSLLEVTVRAYRNDAYVQTLKGHAQQSLSNQGWK